MVISGNGTGEVHTIEKSARLGRSNDNEIIVSDDGVSRFHCRVYFAGTQVILEDLQSSNGTFCNGTKVDTKILQDGDKVMLGRTTIFRFGFQDHLDESFQNQMMESAQKDGMTRVYNKRYFLECIESEYTFANRHRSKLSLLLLDLDHFSLINKNHGHLGGDIALTKVAGHLQSLIRSEDVLARYGGEEFAIIARGIGPKGAMGFSERLRKEVEGLDIVFEDNRIPVTTSIGIACVPESGANTSNELIKCADRALYQAKETGRNKSIAFLP